MEGAKAAMESLWEALDIMMPGLLGTAMDTPPACLPEPLTSVPASMALLSASATVLVLALAASTALSGRPLSHLGLRPMGRGLGSYLSGYLLFQRVGVRGYDSSLGSHPPPLRVLFHLAAYLALWAGMVYASAVLDLYELWAGAGAAGLGGFGFCGAWSPLLSLFSSPVLADGILVAAVYFGGILLVHSLLPGVSHPGGPRAHRIRRQPRWDDRTSHAAGGASESAAGGDGDEVEWRCAVAEDSHGVTLRRFGTGGGGGADSVARGLTGEPAGRQMWTWTSSTSRARGGKKRFDLDLDELRGSLIGAAQDAVAVFSPKKGAKGGESGSTPGRRRTDREEIIAEMANGGRARGFNPSKNPNSCDQVFRAQQIRSYLASGQDAPDTSSTPQTALEAARKAGHFYSMLQTEDGHWAGDYGGPHFLLPGLVVAWYVMGRPDKMIDEQQGTMMRRYLTVHQQSDGGWGTHIESPSTMFGAVVSYVALRLLGEPADSDVCASGRAFIKEHGGATMTSSWAKFWLCLVGCMEWEGHNSVPPEMWLLPNWFPFHPGRLWCHCRMVYLPMGYLYGSRFVYSKAETDPLIAALREELYCDKYNSISWSKTRHLVAPMDNYSPIPLFMKLAQDFLAIYESWSIFQPFKNRFRKVGLEFCVEYMAAEDLQTNFINIGPVNKALNLVSAYHVSGEDINATTVQNHMMRIPDYLWVAEDGMKMQGYNGSQCWDTSFAIQAFSEAKLLDDFPAVSTKVWTYLERTQILSTAVSQSSSAYAYESAENRDRFYRHVSEGGWPFSTSAHGWPISDCTGEGLKAVLALLHSKTITNGIRDGSLPTIEDKRLQNAINVIITLQNEDGGWATYENNRGFGWYEQLNPSEVFGDIMIDYSYVECSMASLTALADFHEMFPNHRSEEIKHCLQRGCEFMKSIQRADGSWYGSWACCFCYGCWFGIEGLIQAGEPHSSPSIQRCCQFLLSQQRPNGGWGEDFTSCYDKDYAENGMAAYGDDGSGVVNTAWALMALASAKCDDVNAIQRGVKYLIDRQLPCGDWPQEGIAGVFNRACGITYTAYRNVFPIWALGRCAATYGHAIDMLVDDVEE